MTLIAVTLLAATTFAETPSLSRQIQMDRAGFSCNSIDGVWGGKSERAARKFLDTGHFFDSDISATNLLSYVTVTQEDLDALVRIPNDPAAKAELMTMGYETIKEMFAERGHLSQRALERLNPNLNWNGIQAGTRIRMPIFPTMDEEFNVWPKGRPGATKRPEADQIRISLSRFEIAVFDKAGKQLALFPCSIAKSKTKLPPHGELRITETVARPNYTYTPDQTPAGKRVKRYIFPPGPNCPVGVAWLGLNLPGYGIHGTPRPESIGNAESHGCFRLSNWNAARLYGLCPSGTRVIVED